MVKWYLLSMHAYGIVCKYVGRQLVIHPLVQMQVIQHDLPDQYLYM